MMFHLLITPALLFLFVFLFFRQDRIDRRKAYRRKLEADLHVLREMRSFLYGKGMDVSLYESAIMELEHRLDV